MIWYRESLNFTNQPDNVSIELIGSFDKNILLIYTRINEKFQSRYEIAIWYKKVISNSLAYEDITDDMILDKYGGHIEKVKSRFDSNWDAFSIQEQNKRITNSE